MGMIRDPSDGSVRSPKPVLDIETTGLAPAMTPHQVEEVKRIERSREWLKSYREKYGLAFQPKQKTEAE